jgi:phosphoribosyl 1,2-cyclic phosphodiesterase
MRVTFWGARGTFPAPGHEFARYGGDTMCIEVEADSARLILDAGSGLRALGARLNGTDAPIKTNIILSHLHLDHIMGLPHFAPLWREDAQIVIHAPLESVGDDPHATVFSVLRPPLFPVAPSAVPASVRLQEFRIGSSLFPAPGVEVRTFAVSHQGACAGMVVEAGGHRLAYVTDHEHGDARDDDRVAAAIEGADLLIYDATFTEEEARHRRGWGHSTWEAGVRLKRRAGIALLALAHHDPDRCDAALDTLAEAAAAASSNVMFARQGLTLTL